jgi:DNA-binding MarR family transcriptional regulator
MPAESDLLQLIESIDPTVHAPTRMKMLAYLNIVESADFTFLLNQTQLTRGNLSANLRKLEEVGYIDIKKEFVERVPRTLIRLSQVGRQALEEYKMNMQLILNELV